MAFGIGCHSGSAADLRVPYTVEDSGTKSVPEHFPVLPRADDSTGRTTDVCGQFPYPISLLPHSRRGRAVRTVVAVDGLDAPHVPR